MTDYNLIVSPKALGASKKPPMVITRKVEFSASHVCRDPKLSYEENQRIYGLAANPHGHGHNYVVEVSLDGDPDP
jgi:6-pyruvoyltetrahydropterin/6-carboxytetrahydropterin synthase